MKKMLLALLLVAAMIAPAGCTWMDRISVDKGEEFSLSLGETVSIRGENLHILFADVIEDSRCPLGVLCIQQGRVRVDVVLTKDGSSYTKTLTQQGLDSVTDSALGYEFTFSVEPYPQAGQEIADGDYRLVMTVSK
jgi:hypothetical protein